MKRDVSGMIHALEFGCQTPLKFYEHCSSCPRFDDSCPDLMLGKEVLSGKKKLAYSREKQGEGKVHVDTFDCAAPLYYLEKTRKTCGHEGRCREEGLLLALLSGKKELDYRQKTALELPSIKTRSKEKKTQELESKIYVVR